MTDPGTNAGLWSAVRRTAWPPAAVIGLSLVVIWAASGGGAFWPMWALLGLAIPVALVVATRWAWAQPKGTSRGYALHAGYSAVVAVILVLVWAMAGGGPFWPIYALVGLVLALTVHRAILGSGRRSLQVRVEQLQRTRSGALDVQAAQLRRIERDLHDGAQARLVALSMQLGRAEERLADHPETAALVRSAREKATAAIRELRDLARGIAPPVLADRDGAMLVVEVADNGPGGADPSGGGLTGLRQRVEALDGRLDVHSAAGEGTVVWAVLPCE